MELAYLCGLLHNVGTSLVVSRFSALDSTIGADDMLGLVEEFSAPTGSMLVGIGFGIFTYVCQIRRNFDKVIAKFSQRSPISLFKYQESNL